MTQDRKMEQAMGKLISEREAQKIVARPGDARFHALLNEIADLHDKKQQDYGTSGDPLANIRGSEQWGIPSWVGAMVRANDKVKRLQKLAKEGALANEAARDSFMDLAVYALLALILFEEVSGAKVAESDVDTVMDPACVYSNVRDKADPFAK
jgi:hypothetical protein